MSGADRGRVVGAGDPVGGADLAQSGAGGVQQLRERKPSPISTSSPRLTTISRPAAPAQRIAARTSAAAPLLTTSAASAAGTAASSASRTPAPRRPALAGGEVELHVARARGDRQRVEGRVRQGARPRLVCRTTPVALRTGRSVVAVAGRASSVAPTTSAGASTPVACGLLGRPDGGLDPLAAQPSGRVREPWVGEHRIGAGHGPALIPARRIHRRHPAILRP